MVARYRKKVANVVVSAALATSLFPVSVAFAEGEEAAAPVAVEAPVIAQEPAAELQVNAAASGFASDQTPIQTPVEPAPSGASASTQSQLAVLEADAVTTAKQLIAALPDTAAFTANVAKYRAQVVQAEAAYNALSAADRAALDGRFPSQDGLSSVSDQPYGRIIEASKWARLAMEPYAATTTLGAGAYNASTTPALSSEYSKGQSTSGRQKPWSVQDITVKDGHVTGTITVQSSSYSYIRICGQKFENTAAKGANCTFENVPIALNQTMYFTGNSTVMSVPYEIAFTLTAHIDERSGQKVYTLDETKALIAALPDAPEVTAAAPGTYDARITEAGTAYDSLSAEDKATLDALGSPISSQSYGRVLESAQWALGAITVPDNSTTLPKGTYSATTKPALTSQYSKGKSTSSRQRPWSVKDVTVVNGKAVGTVTVESSSYTYIYMAGQKFVNTAKAGKNSTFVNVPLDLNSTMYLTAYSTSMLTEIAFSLTTTIEEPQPQPGPKPDDPEPIPLVEAQAAIALLPSNAYKVTQENAAAVLAAQQLYDALSAEDKAVLAEETLPSGVTYERALEVAAWAVKSLAPVDNSTTLADGTYTLSNTDMVSDQGVSASVRQYNWHVEKIMVEEGKAFALMVRDGGNTPIESLYLGGIFLPNAASDGSSQVVIPIDLNSDMYFSTQVKNATESTNALAYHLNTAFDETNATPDPEVDPTPGPEENGGGTSGPTANTTGTVTAVGGGATIGAAQTAAAKNAAAAAAAGAGAATAAQAATAKGAAAEGSGPAVGGLELTELPPLAVGGGFAGVALLGGTGFWALFRKREEHEE